MESQAIHIALNDLDTVEGASQFVDQLINIVIRVCNASETADHCLIVGVLAEAAITQMVSNGHPNCAKDTLVSIMMRHADELARASHSDEAVH